jgi:hypothetical protein
MSSRKSFFPLSFLFFFLFSFVLLVLVGFIDLTGVMSVDDKEKGFFEIQVANGRIYYLDAGSPEVF